MVQNIKSIRPFIGAKDFDLSRNFYRDLGFHETPLGNDLSVFKMEEISFYLQNAYYKQWIENSMIFLEVDDVLSYWEKLVTLKLPTKYKEVKLIPVKENVWGRECFLHDPSGILWHFGEFFV